MTEEEKGWIPAYAGMTEEERERLIITAANGSANVGVAIFT